MDRYDAIVLGLGGMGASAAYHLTRRGLRVLGLEQFTPAHDRGSSHGVTRIIRKAYFEHPDYVPLLHSAYREWAEIERESGHTLFHRTGLLLVGRPDGAVIPGVRRAATAHQLDISDVPIEDVAPRFPGITPATETQALFEPDAGYLLVEDCVRAYLDAASKRGAALRFGTHVREWRSDGPGAVRVTTPDAEYTASTLIICAGPWSPRQIGSIGRLLEVRRKVQLWFACEDERYRPASGFPVFCFDSPEGFFYGFPAVQPGRIKIAEHSGRQVVADADTLDRELHEGDVARVQTFVRRSMPGVSERVVAHSICMYTMTPDENFLIDRHPDHERVFLAAGFSGHGFKFASVVGAILADFAIHRESPEPAGFLKLRQFS